MIRLIFFLFIAIEVKGQFIKIPYDSVSIYYRKSGYIVDSSYKINLHDLENKKRRTALLNEIIESEKLFNKYLNRESLNGLTSKKVIFFHRQYLSYFNTIGERIIEINLINPILKNQRDSSFLKDIEKRYLVGFGGFFDSNVITFMVNLDKRSCSIFKNDQ